MIHLNDKPTGNPLAAEGRTPPPDRPLPQDLAAEGVDLDPDLSLLEDGPAAGGRDPARRAYPRPRPMRDVGGDLPPDIAEGLAADIAMDLDADPLTAPAGPGRPAGDGGGARRGFPPPPWPSAGRPGPSAGHPGHPEGLTAADRG
ncbi:MAG: hypothetical protein LBG06_12400, partial [Deltaproteobacteria bacterium]|nr:hypothetical protein [Deltaproteobacteria bacterium]